MQTIKEAVNAAIGNMVESGVVERAINVAVEKTVLGAISDQLREYSDFGKAVNDAVKKALAIDVAHIDLPSYNTIILTLIRKHVAQLTDKSIAETLQKQLTALLAPAPAQIKISDLVAEFIKFNTSQANACFCDGAYPERITLQIEPTDHRITWIAFDKVNGKSRYECQVRFGVDSDGKIFGLALEGSDVSKSATLDRYGFNRRMFQLYAAGTKIILDQNEDELNTYYPSND